MKDRPRHKRPWRRIGRWLALITAILLGVVPWHGDWQAALVPSLSLQVTLGASLACRALTPLALMSLPLLVLAVFIPRVFCRYLCPTGMLQDLATRIGHRQARDLRSWPPMGRWLVWATLGGALLGYPLFLWMDPLAIFSGFLRSWQVPVTVTSMLAGLLLPLVLLLNWFSPHAWCKKVCPLGATQELLAWPRQWLRRKRKSAGEPTGSPLLPTPASRRAFLALCGGSATTLWLAKSQGASAPLRPPGAAPESSFNGLCLRCGNCTQACPTHIIHPDPGRHGLAALCSPVLSFASEYCREDCRRCTQVCPSGALARLSLPEKQKHRLGLAVVELSRCLLAEGRECTLCISRCPYGALSMQSSADGFSNQPAVETAKCNGCGACEAACPVRPRKAITVKS